MKARQQGVALVGVLAIIPIVALMTWMGLERSLVQTRTAGTAMDRTIALAVAEMALRRAAESAAQWARPPLEPMPEAAASSWRAMMDEYGRTLPALTTDVALHRPPAVLVERLVPTGTADCGGPAACGYRITVAATGRSAGTDVVLQAIIAERSSVRIWRELR
ncbi:pilus assembly PilX family protein [Spiribacter onubensis]|uniref:PilX/PilW C-terminal domain-containing protein n=1 Tax=Spiribacter onubensis TaxID=3122420 RepID=A0ABV3S844_9GAMM